MRKGVDTNAMFDVVLSFSCVDACGGSQGDDTRFQVNEERGRH